MRAVLTDRRVRSCFDAAIDNLLNINTVPCDHSLYNSTSLLRSDRMFRAGGEYETPWTRDAAVNTWNAGRLLAPEAARNTLLAVCTPDEQGLPIIQPDSQKWDRCVWIIGAWEYWLTLREAIRKHFVRPDGSLCYIRYPDGRTDDSKELAGHAFGVLFDLLPGSVLDHLEPEQFGIPSITPPFPGLFSKARPGRHNNLVWPFLNGFYIQAAAKCGRTELVSRELSTLTGLLSDGFREIYSPYDGAPHGGWQLGGDGCTGYLGAVLHGVFGIIPGEKAVEFRPCVPEYLAGSALYGLELRGWRLDVCITGSGSVLEAMMLDGKPVENPIPYGAPGTSQTLELHLRR